MDRYKFRGKPVGDCEGMFENAPEFYKEGYVYGQLISNDIIVCGLIEIEETSFTFEYWAKVEPSTVELLEG